MLAEPLPRQLIVTADDFNLSEGVSRGILAAHQHGIVTETSVMVNLGNLAWAAELLTEAPHLGVGLHLNITRGQPLAAPQAVAELLSASGTFHGSPQALPSCLDVSVVREEFRAQLDRFMQAFGRLPQHLDTHHHVHQRLDVLEALLDLASSWQVPIRSLDRHMRAQIVSRGLRSPAHFLGDAGDEPYWTVERLQATLRTLPPGPTELMCHPGYFDDAIAYSRYGRQRDAEREALCAPEVAATVRDTGVQLGTYAIV